MRGSPDVPGRVNARSLENGMPMITGFFPSEGAASRLALDPSETGRVGTSGARPQ